MKKPIETPKARRGFALMSAKEKTRIAKKGGKAVFKKYGRQHFVDIGMDGGKQSHKGDGK